MFEVGIFKPQCYRNRVHNPDKREFDCMCEVSNENHNKAFTLPYSKINFLVISVIISLSIVFSMVIKRSDFAQDYLAACAIRDGISANLPTFKLSKIYNVPEHAVTSKQVAHPPLVILLAMPFTVFPWETANLLWEVLLCISVGVLLLVARIRLQDLIFLSPAWIFGLAFGNIDGIVVCLCLIAMSPSRRIGMGVSLGLAAALKVYPLLLIFGLLSIRSYRQFFVALFTVVLSTLAATLCLGFNNLIGWILYIPYNGNFFAMSTFNISISKFIVQMGMPNILILPVGIIMLYLQRRQNTTESLLPGMLLIAPTSWLQQITIFSNRFQIYELLSCSMCSALILLAAFFPILHIELAGRYASILLTCFVLIIYFRIIISKSSE